MDKKKDAMDKATIRAAFITGILGIIGTVTAAAIGSNTGEKEVVNQIVSQVKVDTVNIDNINDLIDNYNQLGNENLHLKEDNINLNSDIENLKQENDLLVSENKSLSEENGLLKDYIQQAESLEEENNSLKMQMEQMKDKILRLKDDSGTQKSPERNEGKQSTVVTDSSDEDDKFVASSENDSQKTSIFDLDAYQEKTFSYNYSDLYLGSGDIGNNIDTYGNEYSTGGLRFHSTRPSEETIPTYVLNQEYKMCEGKIAWLKRYKNSSGSIWIEFYEGNSLIYKTEPIEALDAAISFEFSVEGCDELTVVAKASGRNIYVIYPYFNLVK